MERDPYPHDVLHLRVQGKYGDNAPPNLMVSEIAREWNSTWAYPHLRVDRNEEFFEAAVERLGPRSPSGRVTGRTGGRTAWARGPA